MRMRALKRSHGTTIPAAVVLALVAGGTVSGSNFAPYYADGYYVEHYQDLSISFESAHDYARDSVFSPTDMFHPETNLHATSHIHAWDLDLGDTGYFATVWCYTPNGERCSHSHLRYNSWTGNGWTATKRKSVACHEIGHAVGLQHYDAYTSCMVTLVAAHNFPTTLSTHDKSHINSRY